MNLKHLRNSRTAPELLLFGFTIDRSVQFHELNQAKRTNATLIPRRNGELRNSSNFRRVHDSTARFLSFRSTRGGKCPLIPKETILILELRFLRIRQGTRQAVPYHPFLFPAQNFIGNEQARFDSIWRSNVQVPIGYREHFAVVEMVLQL